MTSTSKNSAEVEVELVLPPDVLLAAAADRLVEEAKATGVSLTGQGGLLTGLVRQVLRGALESEITDHLGYEPTLSRVEARGTRATVITPRRSAPRSATSTWISRGIATAVSNR